MLDELRTGHVCCAIYDDIKLETWIKNEILYFRAYTPNTSIEAFKEFYKTLNIALENTSEYVQVSARLHEENTIDKNEYLSGRIETLYKYLILTFKAKITHPLHSIFY